MNRPDWAFKSVDNWFNYLDSQKLKTRTLQHAANIARQGNWKEAQRIKLQVDSAPRVYDGANLQIALEALLDYIKELESKI